MHHITSAISCAGLALVLLLAGCGTTEGGREHSEGRTGGHVVDMEDIEVAGYSSIEEVLVSRVPGVRWSPDGTGIILRGPRSIQGNNEPLYVVDGVPSGNRSPSLDLQEVDEIEVLTDPSALARYGSRGMHGIILIRMKGPPEQ